MSTGTPGPWRASGGDVFGADGYVVAQTDGVHLHKDHDGDKGHWATTPGAARDIPEDEEEANAALIAAAPDLLAIVRRVAESRVARIASLRVAAQAALDRAEGR